MPRQYFQKGTSGNPKGRPKNIRIEVREILEGKGCCPFSVLADLAMSCPSPKVRCEAASELARYIAPQLKSVEITGENKSPLSIIMNLRDMTSHK